MVTFYSLWNWGWSDYDVSICLQQILIRVGESAQVVVAVAPQPPEPNHPPWSFSPGAGTPTKFFRSTGGLSWICIDRMVPFLYSPFSNIGESSLHFAMFVKVEVKFGKWPYLCNKWTTSYTCGITTLSSNLSNFWVHLALGKIVYCENIPT